MARRIRWQILIAVVSSTLVLGLMSYLALTTAAVARPLAGGVFVEYETSHPQQLNPLLSNPARDPVAADLRALLFDGLMRISASGLPEPALAQVFPDVDDSGTVYTFTLRSNLQWHDGQPVTSDDVLFTLRAVQSPGYVGDPQTGDVWRNTLLERIDDQQFQVTLPTPLASFLSYATFPILPAHLLRALPPDQWATTAYNLRPIGTGPYRLSAPLTNAHALLVANPQYYAGRPYLDSIEIRFDQNPQDAFAALSRGEAVGIGLNSTSDASRANTPQNATRHATPLAAYTTLTFNTRSGPLADQALRRALALATDKDTLITQVLGDRVQRVDTPVLPGSWAYDPQAAYRYDPAAGAEALAALGYAVGPDGMRVRDGVALQLGLLTDDVAEHVAVAKEIARQWRDIGVQVTIEQVAGAALDQRLHAHAFTIALHGWQRQGPDPDSMYALWHSSGADTGFNYAGAHDQELDDQLTLGRATAVVSDRMAAYSAFQRRWLDLAPEITLYQPLFFYTATSKLGGLQDQQNEAADNTAIRALLVGRDDRFADIGRWYLRSGREIKGDLRQAP